MDSVIPSVSAGSYEMLARCQRRLHLWLTVEPTRRQGMADRQFILVGALKQALAEAHQRVADAWQLDAVALPLADALDPAPAAQLAGEELALLVEATDNYIECTDGRPGTWIGPPPGVVGSPSTDGRIRLSASVDLAFQLPDGGLEVRIVRLARPRSDIPLSGRPGSHVVALAIGARPYLRLVEMSLLSPACIEEADFAHDELAGLEHRVVTPLLSALHASPPTPTPGWWCGECPFLFGCPAIPQRPVDEVLA